MITNNFGRFFGFTRIGSHNPPGFYEATLLWYAFPALPLAAWAIWTAWRRHDSSVAQPSLTLPLLLVAVMLGVLALASDSRDLYLMPLLLPLSLLAAQGIGELPVIGTAALSQAARWGLGAVAITLWSGWLALLTGVPSSMNAMLLAYQPGFVPKVHWVHLSVALAATAVTARMLARRARYPDLAMTQWAAGGTMLVSGRNALDTLSQRWQELPHNDALACTGTARDWLRCQLAFGRTAARHDRLLCGDQDRAARSRAG